MEGRYRADEKYGLQAGVAMAGEWGEGWRAVRWGVGMQFTGSLPLSLACATDLAQIAGSRGRKGAQQCTGKPKDKQMCRKG